MKIHSSYFKKLIDLSKAQLIGQGNFAQVFKVYDNQLNESLAIRKVKKSQSDMEDINKQKVINEELRKVQNQNILKIYDIIDSQECVWYITEYCSGGSLWDVLNTCTDNKMNQKQCLQVILQISKGVQELHNHRITHRDLKPQNILLKSKYIPNKPLPLIKLADFGLSTQKIIMQTIAGTKQYIAPEQAKFINYTNAVDVWSLGIICDQILHGTPFYSGENNKQVFNKILKLPYKVRDQSIRVSIHHFLMSLLKKKPYQRPIIAVIRKNIEKILQEIEEQNVKKAIQKQRKKEQLMLSARNNNNSKPLITPLNSQHKKFQRKNSKQEIKEILNQIPKSKQDHVLNLSVTKRSQQPQKSQKTIERIESKKRLQNKSKQRKQLKIPELKRQEKNQQEINEEKQQIRTQIQFETVSQVQPLKLVQKDQIIDKNEQQKSERSQNKNQKSLKSQSSILIKSSQNFQFTIYKPQKKKVINQKKQQSIRSEQCDIKQYIDKILIKKRDLVQKASQIKLNQKSPSFLPNTFLSSNEFAFNPDNTSQILKQFKKQYDILNYIQYSDDYDIKLYRKQRQLQKNKNKCLQKINELKNTLKQQFFKQIDNYIQVFVDKSLK